MKWLVVSGVLSLPSKTPSERGWYPIAHPWQERLDNLNDTVSCFKYYFVNHQIGEAPNSHHILPKLNQFKDATFQSDQNMISKDIQCSSRNF